MKWNCVATIMHEKEFRALFNIIQKTIDTYITLRYIGFRYISLYDIT